MDSRHPSCPRVIALLPLLLSASGVLAQVAPYDTRPDLRLDLKTTVGADAVSAVWHAADVAIISATHPSAGPDGRPTGPDASTHDISPQAQSPEFDDSAWTRLSPEDLEGRRGHGKLCFQWYRLELTIPELITHPDHPPIDPTGATITLALRVDDYAEVWVDGSLNFSFAQAGGQIVAGWNATNRVTLTTDARPGQSISVAVFAMNGPISQSPSNYIWIREAALEFSTEPHAIAPEPVSAEIIRFDPRLDAILPPSSAVERLAAGFEFTEGPVWDRRASRLLFSDPNANTIYQWTPGAGITPFMHKSGYDGADVMEYHQPGSNGLTFDNQGRLTIDQHGHRRVIRLEPDGSQTVLADRWHALRLNSPNDLVYRADGALYFTDPAFGLPQGAVDPRKETTHQGVYMLRDGRLTLLVNDLKGPNGIAFSNKQTHLYVGDWDDNHKVVMRYPVLPDGTLGPGEVFADLTPEPGSEAIDGVKVDWDGNVFVCGPGGLWIFAPDGTRLGLLRNVESPHNIAFGDHDGRTLFMTCHTGLYRVRLATAGPMP